MDYPKSVPSVGLVNGKFVDENTVSGSAGSLISASWGNAVTDELLAVIRAAQITPKEDDLDQLLEAIRYIVQNDAYTKNRVYNKEEMDVLLKSNNGVPIGMMVPFPVSAIPAGFLEVDGSLQNSATYPDLAAYLGTRFNLAGDPAGYFRLPESRGEFLRGWDHGRGIDADRAVGSSQLDAFQNITGVIGLRGGTAAGTGVLDGATGAFSTSFGWGGVANTVSRDGSTSNRGDTVFFDASTVARTSTETRPRNLAVVWCIKAWNASVNQGNIDIAGLAEQVQKLSVNGPVVGSMRKGAMSIPSPSATATYTADELVLASALGGQSYRLASFNKSINLATVGVGGMDVGVAPVNGFVAIYAIYNPTTKVSALLATNATAAKVGEVYGGLNMPAGYAASCLLTVVPTGASGQFPILVIRDREVHSISLYVYTTNAQATGALVSINTAPFNALSLFGTLEASCTDAAQLGVLLTDGDAPNITGLCTLIGRVIATGTISCPFRGVTLSAKKEIGVTTSMTGSGTATYKVATSGYTI